MKKKLLSIAFTMLTVCGMWSQDTIVEPAATPQTTGLRPHRFSKPVRSLLPLDQRPISFPFWMVREIALDLEEKQQLELEAELYALEVETYQKFIESMEENDQNRQLQLELSGKNILFLKTQLQAEKQPKIRIHTLIWNLRLLCALGAGFLLGRIL